MPASVAFQFLHTLTCTHCLALGRTRHLIFAVICSEINHGAGFLDNRGPVESGCGPRESCRAVVLGTQVRFVSKRAWLQCNCWDADHHSPRSLFLKMNTR